MTMTFNETMNALNELLEGLTTAENAETVAKAKQTLAAMGQEHEETAKEAKSAKSSLVNLVSRIPVQTTPQPAEEEPAHEEALPDIDDLLEQEIEAVIRARPKK